MSKDEIVQMIDDVIDAIESCVEPIADRDDILSELESIAHSLDRK